MMLIEIERPGGRIAVEVAGARPLVLCVPGMGESRASFRHLPGGLVAAGYRAAAMDLRGHGDSALGFEADHAAHVDRALALLRRPGRWAAFQATDDRRAAHG